MVEIILNLYLLNMFEGLNIRGSFHFIFFFAIVFLHVLIDANKERVKSKYPSLWNGHCTITGATWLILR